jgi:hypothetical protein
MGILLRLEPTLKDASAPRDAYENDRQGICKVKDGVGHRGMAMREIPD